VISKDFVAGLIAILLGSLYLYFAFKQRVSALADTVGPAGMPKVLGILMLSLGIILCIQSVVHAIKTNDSGRFEWHGEGMRLLRALGLLCLAISYLVLVSFLGYIISVAILLALVAAYLGAKLNLRLAFIAGAGALILWAIFVLLLNVPMPSGILL
tara:strand:- start:176 stop:643 length:468 start_codon:yes stop_codon:yes gene_type:complete